MMSLRLSASSSGKTLSDTDVTDDGDKKSKAEDLNIIGKQRNRTVFIVHLNICIYAASFFIQVGTLPVSRIFILCLT